MGNSEVGHLTIGAGRVIYQDVMRITKAIETGAFSRNEVLLGAIRRARKNGRTLHLWGLLSDGSVHSHINHLFALLELAAKKGSAISRCMRCSTGATSRRAPRSITLIALEAKLKALGCGEVATVNGRYFAMDRDKRWERVERAWRAIVAGEGIVESGARAAVEHAYAANQSRRIRRAAGNRRRRSASRRRPGGMFQFPRRSRARADRGARAGIVQRLRRVRASARRLRLHDRIRPQFRIAARLRPRGREELARRGLGARRSPQLCVSPRPKNTRTSRTSSMGAPRSRSLSRSAC